MLLKCKADEVMGDAPPLLPHHHSPSLTTPAHKHQCHNGVVLEQMRELMQVGAQRLDSLHASQLAAQEASGVMAAAMLRQQETM